MVDNCRTVLGIELLLAMQAVELTDELVLSGPARAMHADFREKVPFLTGDRQLSIDIENSVRFLADRGPEYADGLG